MKKLVKLTGACAIAAGVAFAMQAQAGGYDVGGPAVAAADHFSGPYLGVGLGYVGINDKVTDQDGAASANLYGAERAFAGKIYGGWGTTFQGNGYVAGELFYYTTPGDQTMAKNNIGPTNSVKVQARNSYGADVKLGYLVTPSVMPYAVLGIDSTNFKVKDTDAGNTAVSFSSRKTGWFPGVGIDAAVTNNVHLGLRYEYHMYGSFSKTQNGNTEKLEPQRSITWVNLAWRFDNLG